MQRFKVVCCGTKVFGNPPVENMMRTICAVVPLLLLLPVVCGQVDLRTSMFIHYKKFVSWSTAQAFCRKYHTDLLTISSETDNQKIYYTQGWIGLYRDDSNGPWKWSRRDQRADFTSWNSGEPTANKNCAYKQNSTLQWNTDGCDLVHTYNCYDEMLLVNEKKTWEEALNHCRAVEALDPSKPATDYNNNGFDLVTVITQDDYTIVREKMLDATTDEVWTGLRYLAGQWVWAGGESVQYKGIQSCPAQGQDFCGILVKNSTTPYEMRNCQLGINFICYRKPLPTDGI